MRPTTAPDPKPEESARCRSNTPTVALFWKVTKAKCPSGAMATSSACVWPGLTSDPIGVAPARCSRSLTRNTVIPLPPVTTRYCPFGVSASPWAWSSGALSHTPAGTDFWVFITLSPLPAPDTNAKPGVTATSNGCPLVETMWLVTWLSCDARAAWVVQPGTGSGGSVWDADEKGLATKTTTAPRITRAARARRAHGPRRRGAGARGGGEVRRLKPGAGPGGRAG